MADGKFYPVKGIDVSVSGRAMGVIGRGNKDNILDLNKIKPITPTFSKDDKGLHKITL